MKKIILLLSLFFVQINFYAQDNNVPFVEEGKVWNMYYHNDWNHIQDPTYFYHYFIEGDTLISNTNCKKLYVFNENNDNETEYKMALYETEGKVYFIPIGSTESYILYDFQIPESTSSVVSDPIHPEWKIEMRNNKSVVAKINGVSRLCSYVNRVGADFEDCPSGWWIEGIGSELGPLNTWGFGAAGNYRFFWNCEMNGKIIFDKSDLLATCKDEYYQEGTKWTEIRLDTLKYDSWYSKVNGEWVPNFETVEYYIQGEYTNGHNVYKKVYTNGPEWSDSLTLLIREVMYDNTVEVTIPDYDNQGFVMWPATAYQFDWSVGKGLYYRDLLDANSTGIVPYYFFYGVIDEIKEGDFGGVRPLKYVDLDGKAPDKSNANWDYGYTDTNGGRIIQGIGITEWNDGECLFGPPNPYLASLEYGNSADYDRHYRSMLVHFERNGEVLYNVWPEINEPVTFTKDQMATIILPTAPDASKGKYYGLDRCEGSEVIFEQELQPRARVPYIIVPFEDFSIDLSTLDLEGLSCDAVSIEGIRFVGSYIREEFDCPEDCYIDIIDTTPDCQGSTSCTGAFVIGTLRAYLEVDWAKLGWDDPIDHGGSKVPWKKMPVVLHDDGTNITAPYQMVNSKWLNGKCYDLSGRRIINRKSLPIKGAGASGIYIEDGKKKVTK